MSFDSHCKGQRMVVLCTDLLVPGLPVPGVRIVVDSGVVEEATFDAASGVTVVHRLPVTEAMAQQRMEYAGRTASGTCVRLGGQGLRLVRVV